MPDDGARSRRATTGLLAGVPLGVRLVALACSLAAAGAAIIGLASSLAARDSLTRQAGQELGAYAGFLVSRPFTAMPVGPAPGGAASSAFVIEVVSGGRVVMRTGTDARPGPAAAGIPVRAGRPATVPAGSGGGSWLVVAEPVHYSAERILFTYGSDDFSLDVTSTARPGTDGTLVVCLDLGSTSQAVSKISAGYAAVASAAVLGVAILGLALTRAVLRPLGVMEKTAAGHTAHGLAGQASGGDPRDQDECLARSLAVMRTRAGHARASADAARGSSERMRAALAGTCRELRQPVSVIRGFTEYYRHRGPLTAGELDRMMSRVAEEAARIGALIDELAGTGPGHVQPRGNDGRTRGQDRETDAPRRGGHRAPLPPGCTADTLVRDHLRPATSRMRGPKYVTMMNDVCIIESNTGSINRQGRL